MKRTLRRHRLSWIVGIGVVGLAVLLLARAFVVGQPPKPPTPKPATNLVAAPAPNVPNVINMRDFTKSIIEVPAEKVLAARTVPAATPPGDTFVNPKVEPGKVRWHKDFDTACAAAKQSGKPVLLFQMMGKLDDRFC
jgi:hypothetical protein